MSIKLIKAVREGNLAEIKEILKDPTVDINYKVNYSETVYEDIPFNGFNLLSHTPLSIAVYSGKLPIVKYLVEHTANVDIEIYSADLRASSVLELCRITNDKLKFDDNLKLFRYLLPRIKQYNAYYEKYSSIDPERQKISLLQHYLNEAHYLHRIKLDDSRITKLTILVQRIKMLFFEALVRNDFTVLDNMKSYQNRYRDFFHNNQLPLNLDDFSNYIQDRSFDAIEIGEALAGLGFFYRNNYIDKTNYQSAIKLIEARQSLNIGLISAENWTLISTPPSRSIQELFIELQHLLFPEMPVTSMSSAYSSKINFYSNINLNELQNKQQLIELRQILELPNYQLLYRIITSNSYDLGQGAAILLAQLLTHAANEQVIANNQPESLLLSQHKAKAIQVLNKFFDLDDLHKHQILFTHNKAVKIKKLKEEVTNLNKKNDILEQKVESLTSQINDYNQLKNKVQKLEELIEKLNPVVVPDKPLSKVKFF